MPGEGPAAVTLDLFGTLVDFSIERDERPLVAELLEEADQAADPGRVLATWVEASLAERGKTPFRTVRASIEHGARVTADEHGLAIDPGYWASALEALWATRPLREDASEALAALDEADVAWAIVSNVDDAVLSAVLRRTGLGDRAEAVVSSQMARAYKPHPRPFRVALARLGVDPGQAVHVGDDPGEDRAGARAASMQARLLGNQGLASIVEEIVA
jgi:2-haloalkanoic acid dehalogenase type II